MIIKEEIKKRLSEAIKQSGLTQRYIAEKLGIKLTNVVKYANGKSLPKLDTLANLCLLLNVNANDILGVKKT